MVRSNTRDDILSAAARQFAAAGFKGTSLHDIAVEVGVSKAALLYHFDSKETILTEMCGPAIAELAELDARIATATDAATARAVAVEHFADLCLRYRREIQVIWGDLPALLQQPEFASIQRMAEKLHATLAGSQEPAALIAAKVVLAGMPAAAFDDTDHDDPTLRAALIETATRALPPLHHR